MPGVLLHESLHSFFDSKKGEAIKNKAVSQLIKLDNLARNGKGKVAEWMKKAKAAVPKDTPSEHYFEEVLAYAVQHYSETMSGAPVTIKGVVKRFIAEVRAYLVKHTKMLIKIDQAVLAALARQHIGTQSHSKGSTLEAGMQYSKQFSDYIVQALKMLGKGEKDLFQYPDSKAKSFDKIVDDIALNGDMAAVEYTGTQNVDKSWKVTMKATVKGEDATATAGVYQNGKYVWINAISLKEGVSGGSKLYHAVATYAHNNGLVFRGDPAGLKPVAHYRRLENMLSSALRFGTTDHIQPHAKQLKGLNEGGWKLSPLKWVTGDTDANIQAMLDLSAEYVYAAIPAIKDIGFDFETGVFYDKKNEAIGRTDAIITEERWLRYARSQRARKNGIGSTTLKRIVFWNSLRGSKHDSMAKLSKFTHLSGLGEADRIFYSKGRETNGTNLGGFKDETALGWWNRKVSDKFSRLKQVQEHIQDNDGNVNMNNNAYLAEERSSGIIAARIDDMEHGHVDPLLEEMRNTGTSLGDLDEYLIARHAVERNKYIASINPKMQDGGSGISNADALEVLTKVHKADKDKVYKSLAARVYAINRKSVQVMFDGGLIDKKTYDLWTSQYKYYVPLKGKDGEEFGGGTGRGFSVSNSGIKKTMGRGDGNIAESPLAHSISQLKESIIRDEKNKVGRILVKLVLDNPEKELWTITRNDYKRFITENGELSEGLVEKPNNQNWEEGKRFHRVLGVKDGVKRVFYRIDPQYRNNDDVFTTLINGRQVSIFIKDPILAEQMKNLNASKMNSFVATAGVFNRYFAMINTALNPQFVISNFERDLTTAGINIGGEHGKKMFFTMMKSIPSAAKGIANHAFGDKQHPWAKTYEEMRREGGTIGFFGLEDNDTQVKKMQEKLHKNDKGVKNLTRRNLSLVVDKIMDANSVIENATRLAAYKAAKDAGLTRKQAASLSKNLTVNFNRKGEWGATVNALFLFFNASIQGSFRIAKALKHRDVQKIVAAGAAAGFALAAYNMSAGGDDDDGVSKWEKIPNHIKQSNIIFMNSDGTYEKIRLPYGYNVFWYAGVALHEAMYNKKTTGMQIATNMAVTVVNAFNPIQGSNLLDTVIPTILKPISQSITNKNFLGLNIVPESKYTNYEKPDSEKAWGSTNESLKKLMQNINSLTGGDAYHAGLVDVSPETVKHYVKWFTGGAGMTLWQTGETMTDIANDRELKPRGVPFWRMIYNDGDTTRYDSERFYASLEMVEAGKRSYQDLLSSDKIAALRYRLDNKEVIGHINWAKKAKRKVSLLRKSMNLAKKKGDKLKEQRYKLLMLKEMRRFTAELP
ncbi:MAG: LPD38 domain-containing protein [Mariprofundaceae bacterium]|nr:LPD38 domain-containing protein [Mariprofundaceae bacterium]